MYHVLYFPSIFAILYLKYDGCNVQTDRHRCLRSWAWSICGRYGLDRYDRTQNLSAHLLSLSGIECYKVVVLSPNTLTWDACSMTHLETNSPMHLK
jgi:hypothetical protein